MVSVGAGAEADQLTINLRPPLAGMFVFLQHQYPGPIGQYKTISILVPGATGGLGIVVTGGQRPGGHETRHAQGR